MYLIDAVAVEVFRMKQNIKKDQRGSITVEAMLVLPLVFISWLTIINLINIYYLQFSVQQALNSTAQRVAEYCYLIDRTGQLDKLGEIMTMDTSTAQKSSQLKEGINGVTGYAKRMGDLLTNFSLDRISEIKENVDGFTESAQTAFDALGDMTPEDLKEYFLSELSVAGTGMLIGGLVNTSIKDLNIDLKDISKIDYTKSQFLYGNQQQFTIVATYTYHNPLAIRLFSDVEMAQMITMRPWIGASGSGLTDLVK